MVGRLPECRDGALSEAGSLQPPAWVQGLRASGAVRIDVRPILAEGREPFEAIMALASPLAVGAGLILEAPFDPVPLRRVLADQGFETFAEPIAERHWRLWGLRRRKPLAASAEGTPMPGGGTVWRNSDGVHIDVRGLPPPTPLIAVLRLIESDDHDGAIIAHLDRDPVHLYPELADRGWSWAPLEGAPGEVVLRLHMIGE